MAHNVNLGPFDLGNRCSISSNPRWGLSNESLGSLNGGPQLLQWYAN